MSGASQEEIKGALTPSLLEKVRQALAGIERELLPVNRLPMQDIETLAVSHIGGFITLTGGSWSPEARQEWINQALIELATLPASIVFDAARRARQRVAFPNQFVPFCFNDAEAKLDRLNAERARLASLLEISTKQETPA